MATKEKLAEGELTPIVWNEMLVTCANKLLDLAVYVLPFHAPILALSSKKQLIQRA